MRKREAGTSVATDGHRRRIDAVTLMRPSYTIQQWPYTASASDLVKQSNAKGFQ